MFAIVPAIKLILFPPNTSKFPALTIEPGLAIANSNELGVPTKFPQEFSPNATKLPLSNPIPVAVVAVKSPPTFKLAFAPKTIPAGLMRNKFASPPETCNNPSINEAFPPITRPKIFSISGVDKKLAICPSEMPNSSKLWKRLLPSPEVCPP